MTRRSKLTPTTTTKLRDLILTDFHELQIPLQPEQLDDALAQADHDGLSHLQFLHRLIAEQADGRRQRRTAKHLKDAGFRDTHSLEGFDWNFNPAIPRDRIEELAASDFIRRHDNLVFVGQSGVGKSHLMQAIGHAAVVHGYRVRYITSADLVTDLTTRLADHTLPKRIRYYARFDLLIIDEFGFDRLERADSPQAANLLYKIIDARGQQRSTALVSNIDFDAWSDYLGDPPLAMAFLDRLVDAAIILKFKGKSYRAHRANKQTKNANRSTSTPFN
jgi:DNA replication protein DnaC